MKYKFPYLAINNATNEYVLVIKHVNGMSNALGPNVIIIYAEMVSLSRLESSDVHGLVLISYEELKYVHSHSKK